jgi:serine protease AprX
MLNWIRTFFVLYILMFSGIYLAGQDKYFVSFTDKNSSEFSIDNPSDFLTEKSILRRQRQGIEIDGSDIPVSATYVQQLKDVGAKVLYTLRWFNGAVIEIYEAETIELINNLESVLTIKKIYEQGHKSISEPEEEIFPIFTQAKDPSDYYNYGWSSNQIKIHNGNWLHNKGFRGQGITIAVLDAGYFRANTLPTFNSLWADERVLATKDFVNPLSDIYQEHSHGMLVLSVMAGNSPGELIGTAPEANYILIRSEDVKSEQIIEEYNWAAAAEFADSLGADIINSSLGYYAYDAPWQNHPYSSMDGKTTPSSLAANAAAAKGILVVVSAGNEGDTFWKHISTPADAKGILAVGAVNSVGQYVSFSSIGPSADGRIKPEIAAQGYRTVVQTTNGEIGSANGTSFSAPIISGLSACLWQALPNITVQQLIDRIKLSASVYSQPNNFIGFGLPNFYAAIDSLPPYTQGSQLHIYPNPTMSEISIRLAYPIESQFKISLLSYTGAVLKSESFKSNSLIHKLVIPEDYPTGVYFVQLVSEYEKRVGRVVKFQTK